jgi:hypothetical protein
VNARGCADHFQGEQIRGRPRIEKGKFTMAQKGQSELDQLVAGLRQHMEAAAAIRETHIPAEDAKADRIALARRIGRLYLSFSRVLIERLGREQGLQAILEAIRDYSRHCAEVRKKGNVDLPARGIHDRQEVVLVDGKKRLRCYGCGISQEFSDQKQEKLGALYCYIDPCSFLMAMPPIKLIHTRMEPLGDFCCEFDLAVAGPEEIALVEEKNRDYRAIDALIGEKTMDLWLEQANQGEDR